MILDTDLLIALMQGKKDANKTMQCLEEKNDRIATTVISAYELFKGADISSKPERNLTKTKNLLSSIEILGLTLQACQEASDIYREMRSGGCLIGEFDVLIAAIAKTNCEAILTRDKHFKNVKGLNVANW
ncbi:MAG: type II toxin-antitoxin system VapC family toxin [Candidatus Bathyarchaeia archaeon]